MRRSTKPAVLTSSGQYASSAISCVILSGRRFGAGFGYSGVWSFAKRTSTGWHGRCSLPLPTGTARRPTKRLRMELPRTVEDVDRRERVLEQIVGSSHPEAFFEALFTSRDLLSEADFLSVSAMLDSFIRFWPTAADRAFSHRASDGRGLKCWRKGRFADVSTKAVSSYWSEEASIGRLRDLRSTEFGDLQDG